MDDEEEHTAALAAVLDSLRHMSRDEMKTVLLDGSNDPEYIATVDTLFSRDDVSQEQLVEIFKETLFANNAEASDAAPSTSTSKKKKQVYTSSEEEEEVVVHRPTKKRVLPSSDESVDSNETVNLAKVKKKKIKTKEETKPVKVPKKVIETISIESSSDSEIDRRKYTKSKEKSSKEDVSKKPEAKSSKHDKASRKEHRVDKEPSRLKEESSRSRELEKDKRDESKSAARVDRKHSSSDRKDKTSKEEKRKEEKRKAEKLRDEELKREKEREERREQERQKAREEKRQKEREEKREREREEKREKEREEKREKEREEKREKEREEKREKERRKAREEKRERERDEQREKDREEKREKERQKAREEKREREREEQCEKEREEKREKERQKAREEKREREREKERKHSKDDTSKRRDETKTDEWDRSERMSKEERQQSDKYGGDKERFKSVSETDKDTRVKVDDQNLDTKLQAEVRKQVEVDSVKVEEITDGHTRTDNAKNEISAVIDTGIFAETAARSDENVDNQLALASGAGSTDAKKEPAIICDTSAKDISAPVPGSANEPSDAIPSSSLLQQDESLLTKKGSFEAAISTEITKERALEPKDKIKNLEDSRKEVSFPPELKVRVPQVPLTDPDFKKYKKKFRLRRLKIVLYDVQKQKRDMQEGDKVHRAEERKRKKDRHKLPERKEKYSERGTRILPFEKRPENADIYGRKREIVREKPKTETPTEKQKRFAELHKKERENQDKKKIHLIHTDFRIPKAGKKHKYNLVENIISSSTPLAPPVKVSKMHFDKRRMVTTTAKEDSWGLTPEEEAALKKLEKDAEKKRKSKNDMDLIILDDEMPDFGFQDDDNDLFPSTTRPVAADQEADDADSVGYPPTDTPPLPIKECEMNDLSMGVVRLLFTQTCIELADEHATHADVIMQKCGRWFRSVEHEPYYQACPSVPEQTEEEFYTLMEAMEEDEDDVSFIGNVSNPDGDDDLQDSEITSTALDPDQLDEYCGAALLNAKLRVKPGDSPDCFKNILEVRRGCNYDKVNFQAKCVLCEEQITDKRSLGVHLRSSKHRTHLTETSLKLVEMSMKSKKSDSVSVPPDSKTSNKIDSSRSEKDKEKEAGKEKQSKIPENKPKETGKEIKEGAVRREDVKRHRSRSRSPRRHRNSRSRSRGRRSRSRGRRSRSRSRGRRSRSRSPQRRRHRSRSRSFSPRGRHHHRISMSPGRRRMSHVDESLGRSDRRRSRSPKAGVSLAHRFKETDDLIFKEKLKLVANGKWTTQLEGRWKLKEEEEAQLKKIFVKKRKNLEEKPEEHELYNGEWSTFWERRYQELLEENKDPDDYDYTPEWKVHWKKFSEEILDKEFATRMEEIRTKFGLDLSTLRALNTASAPPLLATPNLGHGPIPPPGHPIFNPLVPPLGIPGNSVMPPMPMVPPVHVPMVGAPPLPVGPIPPTFPATMGYPAVAPPPVSPIVNARVPPVHPVQAQGLTSMSSAQLASTPARNLSAEPPLVGRHSMGEDYEAKPMSISSGSNISGKPEPPAPAVTVDDVKNTWLNYTGQKMTAAVVAEAKSIASNASSGKSQAFDYDGLDVVHVLRIMLGLEDELSFLAIQVQNYYQKAEKLEAEEKRKSFGMLSEADFVNLLKQCRDKFYAILKANVSPSDVMKKLNLAVFALNALLESSACEKLRPAALPPAVVDLPKVSPKSPPRPVARELSRDSSSLHPSRAMSNPIADALAHLPQKLLVEMSSIIATSLIAQGKDRLSDTELNSNLLNIFRPVLRHTVGSPGNIDPQPSGQGSFSGLKSGTAEPKLRKSGGSVTEDEGFGMTSFLPRGGGGSWGRDGRNPIPEDQEKSDIRSTQENRSPFANEPGPSKVSKKLGDLEGKSSELQTPSSQLHNRNDEEPFDPENEYRNPALSYERRKSVEIVPKSVDIIAPTPVDKAGPRLPAGIANLIQKEKTARTLGAAGVHSSTNLDFRRPDRSASLRVDRLVNATSSISSISEIGEVEDSKRYRRKSKKLKAEADNKHKSEHRKKRRRHSQISPERSTKRARDERHPSRRHSDGMDRMPESRHAESHRKERHRGKEHRKRRSVDGKEPEKSDEHQGSDARRRRRSKTKKKHKRKESTDSKVDGVSRHFWNESGSTISSEDNIPDSQGRKDKAEDEIQVLGRHVPAYRESNAVEEGELICTSEEDFSDSPRSQEGNKDVALQSEDIVSEGDSWDKAEG